MNEYQSGASSVIGVMEKINIRLERPNDYKAVERLTFAAFETHADYCLWRRFL
jgi:hypothetical protein